MKTYTMALSFVLIIMIPAHASEVVIKVVNSGVPIIIDGNWIYPKNGSYEIVMTDSNLTVNGYEYVHPAKKTIHKYEPPSREKGFMDWIIRTTSERAQNMVDSGATAEDVKKFMQSRYDQYADGDTFWYSFDNYGNFRLFCGYPPMEVIVPVPSHPRNKAEPIPPYRERVLEGCFKGLCSFLENGYLVMINTAKNSLRAFAPREVDVILKELKEVPQKAIVSMVDGEPRYHSMVIADRYKLTPLEVRLLVNPQKLINK